MNPQLDTLHVVLALNNIRELQNRLREMSIPVHPQSSHAVTIKDVLPGAKFCRIEGEAGSRRFSTITAQLVDAEVHAGGGLLVNVTCDEGMFDAAELGIIAHPDGSWSPNFLLPYDGKVLANVATFSSVTLGSTRDGDRLESYVYSNFPEEISYY